MSTLPPKALITNGGTNSTRVQSGEPVSLLDFLTELDTLPPPKTSGMGFPTATWSTPLPGQVLCRHIGSSPTPRTHAIRTELHTT